MLLLSPPPPNADLVITLVSNNSLWSLLGGGGGHLPVFESAGVKLRSISNIILNLHTSMQVVGFQR